MPSNYRITLEDEQTCESVGDISELLQFLQSWLLDDEVSTLRLTKGLESYGQYSGTQWEVASANQLNTTEVAQ